MDFRRSLWSITQPNCHRIKEIAPPNFSLYLNLIDVWLKSINGSVLHEYGLETFSSLVLRQLIYSQFDPLTACWSYEQQSDNKIENKWGSVWLFLCVCWDALRNGSCSLLVKLMQFVWSYWKCDKICFCSILCGDGHWSRISIK